MKGPGSQSSDARSGKSYNKLGKESTR